MARIIGALATAHTPTIGFAVDTSRKDISMRGERLKQFQKSRNAAVLYSVAGKDSFSDLTFDAARD